MMTLFLMLSLGTAIAKFICFILFVDDPQTKPADLCREPVYSLLSSRPYATLTVAINHY